MKITKSIAGYFDNHQVDEFYFCSNGTAFKKENDALANQKAIDGGKTPVEKITREQVEEWRNESGETERGAEGESKNGETERGTETVNDTPEAALGKAQVALEEAMKGGNEEAIAAAKKVVSTAKARVTREAKKNAE